MSAEISRSPSSWASHSVLKISNNTGTTYSCVATYEGSNVEIIANEQGSFTTPSFVSFTDKERLIGEAAKNNAAMNPANTVFDAK
jgi:heat shock 70kDa protein 1/2/6/8